MYNKLKWTPKDEGDMFDAVTEKKVYKFILLMYLTCFVQKNSVCKTVQNC